MFETIHATKEQYRSLIEKEGLCDHFNILAYGNSLTPMSECLCGEVYSDLLEQILLDTFDVSKRFIICPQVKVYECSSKLLLGVGWGRIAYSGIFNSEPASVLILGPRDAFGPLAESTESFYEMIVRGPRELALKLNDMLSKNGLAYENLFL